MTYEVVTAMNENVNLVVRWTTGVAMGLGSVLPVMGVAVVLTCPRALSWPRRSRRRDPQDDMSEPS